jgi:hypothetical protein
MAGMTVGDSDEEIREAKDLLSSRRNGGHKTLTRTLSWRRARIRRRQSRSAAGLFSLSGLESAEDAGPGGNRDGRIADFLPENPSFQAEEVRLNPGKRGAPPV